MRAWPMIAVLAGCPGPSDDTDGVLTGDQLRALGVNVGGFNVIHGEPASLEARTDLGPTPLATDAYLTGGEVAVRIVGDVVDWRAELVGDPAFTFVIDDFFGDIVAVRCVPPAVGAYAADMVVTAPSQPGREFRVPFACQGDDRARILPLDVQDVGADGTMVGRSLGTGLLQVLGPDGSLLELDTDGTVARTGVLDDGGVVLAAPDGVRQAAPGAATTTLLTSGTVAGAVWPASDGSVALYTDASTLRRASVGADEPVGPDALYTELLWADADGRWALTNSGTAVGTTRDLVLIDSETGDHAPFLDPAGEPWASGWGTGVVALSQDRTRFLRLTSYYYQVALAWVDVGTGAETELLDAAQADMAERFGTTNHAISDVDVTPDGRFAAVVFDDIASDPGGFQLRGSAVYVLDLDAGTTWLASVGVRSEAIRFALDAFDGRLVEHVRIRPDASQVVFGGRYLTERSLWVEVP